jgi:microcin C transport system permease protein
MKTSWRKFNSLWRARISFCLLFALIFFSSTAEFWANNKPIVMSVDGHLYAPIFSSPHPSTFQQQGFVTNYKTLSYDWALWPALHWSPDETNPAVSIFPSPPSATNWFGTDDRGRDVLTRLLYGFRYSLTFALAVWFFSFLTGTIIGTIMGFFGGRVDLIGQRFVEMFEAIPTVLVLLTLLSLLGAKMTILISVAVLFGWMRISLYMRAEVLKLRKREFIEAGRAQGLNPCSLIVRHILPNALGPLLTLSPAEIAANIYLLAVLDYLGMGLPAPTPSWGELLQQANNSFTIAWWLALFPCFAMIVVLVCLTFIGDGVRHASDPHTIR